MYPPILILQKAFIANGNIIWEKKIGSPYYNTIGTSIRELPDGNLIASGSVYDTTIYKNKGLIIKLSSQGDSLWDRMYEATPGINSDCFLNDIAQTEDKGFIAIGVLFIQAPDTGTQDTWILKVDSNGCEVTNCSYMGIINTQSENGSIVSVYPNPFNSAMIIKIESESNDIQGYITITDIFGREIFRQELFETENKFEFNGSHLDPGIYFVSLINKAGLQSTVRIVKI